jgi:hypothetical protein
MVGWVDLLVRMYAFLVCVRVHCYLFLCVGFHHPPVICLRVVLQYTQTCYILNSLGVQALDFAAGAEAARENPNWTSKM